MKKIAVTAASGQLGKAIVKQLINEIDKDNIIAIARTPQKISNLGVEVRKGDYNSYEDFDIALKGVDTLLLVSGMDAPDKRIMQHRNVIEAAKQNKVQKIVYTSVVGDKNKTSFAPIIESNRQTEEDIKKSGLDWSIGRNGLYIEPDLEYIDKYVQQGGIVNSAGNEKCAYTSRDELGIAYAKMLIHKQHNYKTYNLIGEPITQTQLANYINQVYHTNLTYSSMDVKAYTDDRKVELGDFLGTVIGSIYESIRNGAFNIQSHFEEAVGRPHKPTLKIINEFKNNQKK